MIFGSPVSDISVDVVDGQWMLRVRGQTRGSEPEPRFFSYDEAHRRLKGRLGWDAMPSPASRVERTARGFRAEGVGFGHRVGLCLARD